MSASAIIDGSHLKKVVGHGGLYFLASLFTKAASALLLPVYTRYLSPGDYGVYYNIIAYTGVLGIFISFYMDSALGRLYFDQEGKADLARLFSTLLFTVLGLGTVASVGGFLVLRPIVGSQLGVSPFPFAFLTVAIAFFTQLNSLAAVVFRSSHRSKRVTGVQFAGFVLGVPLSLILLVLYGSGAEGLLYGVLLCNVFVTFSFYYTLYREGWIRLTFSPAILKESVFLSLGFLPLSASSWISNLSDRILITYFGTTAEAGLYSTAYEIALIIQMVYLAIFMAYSPMIMAMLKEGREKNIGRIEQFNSFYIHLLAGTALFLSLFSREIVMVLTAREYHGVYYLIPIIAAGYFFQGLRKFYATLVFFHKKNFLISLGAILQAVLNFGLNFLLIPKMGKDAAAWTTLMCMVFVAAYFYVLMRKYEPIRLDLASLRVTVSILVICLAGHGIVAYVFQAGFWTLVGFKSVLLGFALLATWWSRFGAEIRSVLRSQGVVAHKG